jgi:hypothetical protein
MEEERVAACCQAFELKHIRDIRIGMIVLSCTTIELKGRLH